MIWALAVTLTLERANQSSSKTLWPMTMHDHTKFGYKGFNSCGHIHLMNFQWNSVSHDVILCGWLGSEHQLTNWNFEPFLWCWPRSQQSNPIFSKHNPDYDDVLSNQVWLQQTSRSEYILESNILITRSFTVTLTLKKANQSFAGSWRCTTTLNMVVKGSAVQKILSG